MARQHGHLTRGLQQKFKEWQRYVSEEGLCKSAMQEATKWYSQHSDEEFTMLLIGETGSGKSTLINNFAGEEVAPVGHSVNSETSEINKYSKTINGVNLVIYDSPGHQDSREGEADQKHMRELKERLQSSRVDLVVFCYRMDNNRLTKVKKETFRAYHNLKVPWEKTIFAITCANNIDAPDTVQEKLTNIKDGICTFFRNDAALQLSDETVDNIAFCPTGRNPKLHLVNYSRGEKYDWFTHLWFTALERLDPESMIQLLELRHGDERNRDGTEKDALLQLVSMYKGEWKYRWRKIVVKILEFIRILDKDEGTHQTDEPQPPQQGEQEDGLENNHDIDASPV